MGVTTGVGVRGGTAGVGLRVGPGDGLGPAGRVGVAVGVRRRTGVGVGMGGRVEVGVGVRTGTGVEFTTGTGPAPRFGSTASSVGSAVGLGVRPVTGSSWPLVVGCAGPGRGIRTRLATPRQ